MRLRVAAGTVALVAVLAACGSGLSNGSSTPTRTAGNFTRGTLFGVDCIWEQDYARTALSCDWARADAARTGSSVPASP